MYNRHRPLLNSPGRNCNSAGTSSIDNALPDRCGDRCWNSGIRTKLNRLEPDWQDRRFVGGDIALLWGPRNCAHGDYSGGNHYLAMGIVNCSRVCQLLGSGDKCPEPWARALGGATVPRFPNTPRVRPTCVPWRGRGNQWAFGLYSHSKYRRTPKRTNLDG